MLGSGTEGDPYIIQNVSDLQDVDLDLAAWYELEANIEAAATSGWNGGLGFKPIGFWEPFVPGNKLHGFKGHFDGKGYTIFNLFIDRDGVAPPQRDCIGLFAAVSEGGEVKNVTLSQASIEGFREVGGVVGALGTAGTVNNYHLGTGDGHLINCHVNSSTISVANQWGGCVAGYIASDTATPCTADDSDTSDCTLSGTAYLGGFTSSIDTDCVITNCFVHNCTFGGATLSYTGGLVGYLFGVLDLCWSDSNLNHNGGAYVGGLIGGAWLGTAVVTSCYATGNVIGATGSVLGGLVGYCQGGSFTDCYASGNISGDFNVGGFAGFIAMGFLTTVHRCYSTGTVVGVSGDIGGFIGYASGTVLINECFATGSTTSQAGAAYTGGFIGEIGAAPATVYNSYARGVVSNGDNIAGFVGYNNGTIAQCYSTGLVTPDPGPTFAGGFCGENAGTIRDSYWDVDSSGFVTSDGGTGQTTGEMKTQITFDGWDFNTIWALVTTCNDQYPCLRNVTACCVPVTPTLGRSQIVNIF